MALVHFQQTDPPGRMPGICWVASLYADDNGMCSRPLAVAWLSDFRGSVMGPDFFSLDYIMVPDDFRRKGYATELIEACKAKWPGMELTEAISDAGSRLLESFSRQEPAPRKKART